jgi:hypothetical protein
MSGLAAKSLQEAVALVGTGALFLVCRGPGSALVTGSARGSVSRKSA